MAHDDEAAGDEVLDNEEQAPAGEESKPFPFGVKDSAIPPPLGTETDGHGALPLGARPAEPSLPPRTERRRRPSRPRRSPLADSSMPDALRSDTFWKTAPEASDAVVEQLPQGVQDERDMQLVDLDEPIAERAVAPSLHASVGDEPTSSEDDFTPMQTYDDDARTDVSDPSEEIRAAERRERLETFEEEGSTVVTPEAPQYSLETGPSGGNKKVFVTLVLLLLLLGGIAAYFYFQKNAVPISRQDPVEKGSQAHEPGSVADLSAIVDRLDASDRRSAEGGAASDSTISDDIAETEAQAEAEEGTEASSGRDETLAGVQLPEVPASIERLSARSRARGARTQVRLANRLNRKRRVDSALWHYDRALTFDPKLASAARGKARALLGLGRTEGALAWAGYAAELEPASTHSWTTMGEVYLAAAKKNEAIAAFKKAVTLSPRNRRAKRQLARLRD